MKNEALQNRYKFRAWDKLNKRFLEEVELYNIRLTDLSDKTHSSHYIIMQGTNLRDKDGTEIYFDDLIQHQQFIYQIVWNTYGIAIKCIRHITEDFSDLSDGGECIKRLYGGFTNLHEVFNFDSCKIIGSIYENPNLLIINNQC